jgi:hypothetical protein
LSRDVPYPLLTYTKRDNSVGDSHHALPSFEKSFGVARFKPKLNFTEKIGGEQYIRAPPKLSRRATASAQLECAALINRAVRHKRTRLFNPPHCLVFN